MTDKCGALNCSFPNCQCGNLDIAGEIAQSGSTPDATDWKAQLYKLEQDLKPFAHKTTGSIRIDMNEVRAIIGASDALTAAQAENEKLRKALNPPFAHREDCVGACLDVTCLGCVEATLAAVHTENEKLKTRCEAALEALTEAIAEVENHNAEYQHGTPRGKIDRWKLLTPQPSKTR